MSIFFLIFFSLGVGARVWVLGCGRAGVGARGGGLRMGRAEDGAGWIGIVAFGLA